MIEGTLTLIGVTSWGDDFCQEFGANSRTDTSAAFIQSVIDGEHEEREGPDGTECAGREGTDCCSAEGGCGEEGSGDGEFDEEWDQEEWEREMGDADPCEVLDWYSDDVCNEMCKRPDPDCGAPADSPPIDEEPADDPPVDDEVPVDDEPVVEDPIDEPIDEPADEPGDPTDTPGDDLDPPDEDDLDVFAGGDVDEPAPSAFDAETSNPRRSVSSCATATVTRRTEGLLGMLLRR